MKIAHISDIHIRSNSRHAEYGTIFDELYKKLRENNVDCIVLCGDIAHTKTQEAPEFYDFTAKFFTRLSMIAPVHIMLGNHDGNLLNPSRLDVITPIVNMLENDSVFLHKDSQRVDIGEEISLFVYSLFDKSNWNNWKIDNNNTNIALFHGSVSGARTDLNFYLDSEIDISEFNQYDYTMLGDIHKHQYLDNEKRVAYSGDLIQQNYGEDIEKGFLIWDIESKDEWKTEFITLQPVNPFFTLEFDDITDVDVHSYSFIPENSRIRLKLLKEFDSRKLDKLAHAFKHELKAKEITTINDIRGDTDSVIIDSKVIKLEDLRNEQVQEQLIQDYLKRLAVEQVRIDNIVKINSRYNTKLTKNEELARNIDWKIKNLTFSNAYAFKENNNINFEKLKGIVGVFGPNTIGKSSIIDIILYGIFNSNSKGIVKNLDIVNTRKKKCSAKLSLEVNKVQYVIDRMTTKLVAGRRSKSTHEHARTDLDFYKIEDGKHISLNGLQRSDTEKGIRKLFGTSDDFLTSCVAAQGDMNYFIKQRSTKRKEIIGKFLDLDIFEDKYRLAKEQYNSHNSQLKTLKGKDYNKLIDKHRDEEQALKDSHVYKKQKRIDLRAALREQRLSLTQLNDEYEHVKSVNTYNHIIKELVTLHDVHNTLESELALLTKDELSINKTLNGVEHNLEEKLNDIKEKLSKARTSLETLNNLESKKDKTNIIHEQLQKSIMLLDGIPCGDKYSGCKFIKDSYASKDLISNYELQLKDLQQQIDNLNKNVISNKVFELKQHRTIKEGAIKHRDELESKVQLTQLHIMNKKLEIKNALNKIDSLENNKAQLEDLNVHKLDSFKTKSKINALTSEISNTESEIKKLDRELTSISQKQGEIKGRIRNLITQSKEYKEISTICYEYELYARIMSKNGIQQEIIRNKLSFINSEINKLLRNVAKFKIQLIEENDKLDIYIDYGDAGGSRIIETASGAEKALTSVAIRVALTRISTLPKPNIFIIDESFGSYDETNKVSISRMLQLLKQYFTTILVVTHIDDIKDCVDYILTIERDSDKFSYVN